MLYSLFGVLTVFGTGNATQVNTIVTAIDSALLAHGSSLNSILPTVNPRRGRGGGHDGGYGAAGRRQAHRQRTEKLVPFMALFYVVLALGVVVINYRRFPAVLASIVGGAFDPQAFTGGAIGSIFLSMQKGVSAASSPMRPASAPAPSPTPAPTPASPSSRGCSASSRSSPIPSSSAP